MTQPAMRFLTIVAAILLQANTLFAIQVGNLAFSTKQISSEPGVYLTFYRSPNQPPKEIEEFDYFSLKESSRQENGEITIDCDGNVPLQGKFYTTGGLVYKLKTGKLIKGKGGYEQLVFKTEEINGVWYAFEGKYLADTEEENGQFIILKGKLNKYIYEDKIVSANLGLYQAGEG